MGFEYRRLTPCAGVCFSDTVQDIWARNAGADADEIQRILDEAVAEVRAERRTERLTSPDARGARYQHHCVRPTRSHRQAAAIVGAWLDGRFTFRTGAAHIDELRATLQKPRIDELIKPHKAGRLVNQIKSFAGGIDPLPRVERSPDADDYRMALADGGQADYLVTGEQRAARAR